MSKTIKWILISIGVIIVLLFAVQKFRGSGNDGVKVTVEKITKRTITESVNASGQIYPEVEVKVSPDISGEITELTVQEGDSVKKGQILARIYADVYSSQRDQAAAQVAQSQATVANSATTVQAMKVQLDQDKTNYNRNKELYDQKVISKAELEQYDTKYRTSQAQYNAARQQIRSLQANVQGTRTQLVMANKNLGRATIVAPMDGVVSMLNVKKGERVVGTAQMAGTEMMRVADMSKLEVRVDVGENDIVKINIGDSADVEVDAYNNRKFRGIVTQIASSTSKGSGIGSVTSNDVTNYEVHIRLDPASYQDLIDPVRAKRFPFRPGMNASADIKTRRKDNVIAVPIGAVAARVKGSNENIDDKKKEKKPAAKNREESQDAIASDELEEVVFVVNKEGKVEKKVVTTGIQDINYIEILSGLNIDDQVVSAPYTAISKTLRSGTKVNIVSKDKLFEK